MVIGGIDYNIGDTVHIYKRCETGGVYDRHEAGVKQRNIWRTDYTIVGFGRSFVVLRHPAGYNTSIHVQEFIRYREPPRKIRNASGHWINSW